METVPLSLATYEEVRSHANRYFIVAGHQTIAGESVVMSENGYSIVEKDHVA